jgi:hypothetical protein
VRRPRPDGVGRALDEAPIWIRGILEDITGRAHYTAGNIAERTGLSLARTLDALADMAQCGVVTRVDGSGPHSTWELCCKDIDEAVAKLEKRSMKVDKPLR